MRGCAGLRRGNLRAAAASTRDSGGTLIDGNGGAPVANSVIVIQGNQITAAGAANQVQVPAGNWILPGLWDCQQNFSWFYSEPQLNQGVTAGCDIGNGDEWGIVHRDAVNHGKIRGSRVWVGVGHLGGVNPEELTGWETPVRQTEGMNLSKPGAKLPLQAQAPAVDVGRFVCGISRAIRLVLCATVKAPGVVGRELTRPQQPSGTHIDCEDGVPPFSSSIATVWSTKKAK